MAKSDVSKMIDSIVERGDIAKALRMAKMHQIEITASQREAMLKNKISAYTENEARIEYAKLCDTIFNILNSNGWNEEDLAVLALREVATTLEEKYGFYTCDDD